MANRNREKPILLEEPIVFFDISIGGVSAGRMYIKLFINQTPQTVKNFRLLCNGTSGAEGAPEYCYKFSSFHRVVRGFMCQGGDFTNGDGYGGFSAIGNFKNENYELKHAARGALAMANRDPDVNGSQFYITFGPTPWLDGKHVVFGQVTDKGMPVLDSIENVASANGDTPTSTVIIEECGEIINEKPVLAENKYRWLNRVEGEEEEEEV